MQKKETKREKSKEEMKATRLYAYKNGLAIEMDHCTHHTHRVHMTMIVYEIRLCAEQTNEMKTKFEKKSQNAKSINEIEEFDYIQTV